MAYSEEIREDIVMKHIVGGMPMSKLARQSNVNDRTIAKWVKAYCQEHPDSKAVINYENEKKGVKSKPSLHITSEQESLALKHIKYNRSLQSIISEYKVDGDALRDWINSYLTQRPDDDYVQAYNILKEEIGRLHFQEGYSYSQIAEKVQLDSGFIRNLVVFYKENEQKGNQLPFSQISKEEIALKHIRDFNPVNSLAQTYGISKSSLFSWVKSYCEDHPNDKNVIKYKEVKNNLIHAHLTDGVPIENLAKEHNLDPSMINGWISAYNTQLSKVNKDLSDIAAKGGKTRKAKSQPKTSNPTKKPDPRERISSLQEKLKKAIDEKNTAEINAKTASDAYKEEINILEDTIEQLSHENDSLKAQISRQTMQKKSSRDYAIQFATTLATTLLVNFCISVRRRKN